MFICNFSKRVKPFPKPSRKYDTLHNYLLPFNYDYLFHRLKRELYIRFIHGVLNDVEYIYDECFTMIRRVNELEQIPEISISRSEMNEILYYEKVLSDKLAFLDVNLMFVGLSTNKIIDILFNIYDKCYFFTDNGDKKLTDKNFIQTKKLTILVFE